jgi:hypothetical protein
MKRTAGLATLPPDILVHIQSFIEPYDILSLRKCSKTLLSATRERCVWTTALQYVIQENDICKATFPVQEMSINALEHAATSLTRFSSFLWRQLGEVPLGPVAEQIIHSKLSAQGNFWGFAVASGGRFLVTSTDAERVQLWDLGYAAGTFIGNKPRSSIHIPNMPPDGVQGVQNTLDGMGILVLVKIDHDEYVPSVSVAKFAIIPSF